MSSNILNMRINLLLSVMTVLISSLCNGQNNPNYTIKDSTKISIIGNTVYRVHEEIYRNNNQQIWKHADSTSFRYTKVIILNVLFNTSKSKILKKSFKELNELSTLLINNPEIGLQIVGHTDKIGNSKSNLKLSKKRSKAIKNYLMEKGVKSKRMITNGFGDKFPICQSPCKKNRRVEFKFISLKNRTRRE